MGRRERSQCDGRSCSLAVLSTIKPLKTLVRAKEQTRVDRKAACGSAELLGGTRLRTVCRLIRKSECEGSRELLTAE